MSDESTAEKPEQSNLEPEVSEKNVTIKKSTYKNMVKGIIAAIAIAAFFGGYTVGTLDQGQDFTAEDLRVMLTEIARSNANPQPAQAPQPSGPQMVKVSLDDDPVKGDPNAPITIVEFSDFQCPFCSRFYDQTLPLIQQNYIDTGKIKFVYRDFPIDSLHPNARPAHIAAECADEQGKFWDYHDILFERVNEWQSLPQSSLGDQFVSYSDELELDLADFISCLQSPVVADEVHADYLAGVRYEVTGTPGFFVGTEKDGFIKLNGAQPYSVFAQVIESIS